MEFDSEKLPISEDDIKDEYKLENGRVLHTLPWKVHLGAFPVFTMFGPPWMYFFCLCVYIMTGRWSGYLPTISETGTLTVGHTIESRFFASISLSTFFTDIVVSWYVFERSKTPRRIRNIAAFLYLANTFGMIGTGVATMFDHHHWHFMCALLGLFIAIIHQVILWRACREFMTPWQKARRAFYIVGQVLGLSGIELTGRLFDLRFAVTLSTICEYTDLTMLQCFMISYWSELEEYDLYTVIIEE